MECVAPVAQRANSNEADSLCMLAVTPVAAGNSGGSSGGSFVNDASCSTCTGSSSSLINLTTDSRMYRMSALQAAKRAAAKPKNVTHG